MDREINLFIYSVYRFKRVTKRFGRQNSCWKRAVRRRRKETVGKLVNIAYPTVNIATSWLLTIGSRLIWSSLRTSSLCSASSLGCQHDTARICYVLRRRCCQAPVPAAVDRYLLPTRRSAANPPHTVAAVDRQDRRTDGRTLDRFIDPALHTMRVVSITDYRCRTQTWVFITFPDSHIRPSIVSAYMLIVLIHVVFQEDFGRLKWP